MDIAYKFALTATVVAMVMMTARLFGRHAAGLLTGLPIITAPALVWVGIEQGRFAAASFAVGSVAACAVAALFCLCYAGLARRAGPAACLGVSTLVVALGCIAARGLLGGLFIAFVVSVVACAAALRFLPRSGNTVIPRGKQRSGNLPLTTLIAGLMSVLATPGQVDPFVVGLLAGLPIVAATVAVSEHACAGPLAVSRFLRGYIAGLIGKAAFGVLFALLLIPTGPSWALLVAGVASGLICALGVSLVERPVPIPAIRP